MNISEAISKMEAFHAPLDHPHTCDTVKIGDVGAECTGIAVTCSPTVDAIRAAIEKGCNLLIVHEPLFYNDRDETDWLGDDPVYSEKRKLLTEAGMVVWRDHDHMHGPGRPDAPVHKETDYIFYGIMKELGWEPYLVGESTKPLFYNIPPRTVSQLAHELIDRFDLTGARIVGDREAIVSKVFVCEHVMGGRMGSDEAKIRTAADYDVMIPLEIIDWSLSSYVRDAAQFGKGKAIIEMGHFNTEELGMLHLSRLIPEIMDNAVPVHYIKSGDSFSYILKA